MITDNPRLTTISVKLQEKIEEILHHAEREDSLDYFKIEISNHNGSLQVDYSFRERVKVY